MVQLGPASAVVKSRTRTPLRGGGMPLAPEPKWNVRRVGSEQQREAIALLDQGKTLNLGMNLKAISSVQACPVSRKCRYKLNGRALR